MPLRTGALILVAAGLVLFAYYEPRPVVVPASVEAPPPPPDVPEPPTWTPDLRPARPAEVVAAMQRAFPGALPPEALQVYRAVVGDFNGDRSPDLAVPARALSERLEEINASLANWILEDPDTPAPPPLPHGQFAPVVVAKGEMLLAVLHGVGGAGWRSPDARQCYLLKIGSDGPLEVQKRGRGDLIYQPGSGTFLYWDRARYARHKGSRAARVPLLD